MRFLFTIGSLLLPAMQMFGGTIDPMPANVSSARTQWLNPEDKLEFTVSASSYEVNAAKRGSSVYPTQVTFQFLTAPETQPGDFTAVLESSDGSFAVDFPGPFSWLTGRTQSSGYTGAVSVLYGSMSLSAAEAEELFGPATPGPSLVLVLENQGSSVNVGLPPYTLGQDLSVSFSGGGFGVSGPVSRVQYLDPPAHAPEPNPGTLLSIAGALWWAASKGLSRLSRRRIERI